MHPCVWTSERTNTGVYLDKTLSNTSYYQMGPKTYHPLLRERERELKCWKFQGVLPIHVNHIHLPVSLRLKRPRLSNTESMPCFDVSGLGNSYIRIEEECYMFSFFFHFFYEGWGFQKGHTHVCKVFKVYGLIGAIIHILPCLLRTGITLH